MKAFSALLVILLFVAAPLGAHAQEVGTRYRVVLADGGAVVGTLVSMDDEAIVLRDERGLDTIIPRERIASYAAITSRFSQSDPNDSRLFVFPSARTMGAGSARFGTYTLFPSVAVGATDWLDLSLGSTFPVDGGIITNLNAKVGLIQRQRLSVAVGASALVPLGYDAGGFGGTFYGVATLGTSEEAVSIGAVGAYGASGGDFDVAGGAGLMLGYEKQMSNRIKFITENYAGLGDGSTGVIVSGGVRFFGDNLSADITPVAAIGGGGITFVPIPYFSFSYAFGR